MNIHWIEDATSRSHHKSVLMVGKVEVGCVFKRSFDSSGIYSAYCLLATNKSYMYGPDGYLGHHGSEDAARTAVELVVRQWLADALGD